MTDLAGIDALVDAIRHMHGVEPRHAGTEHVEERTPDGREIVWEGDVEVFDLDPHPSGATRAYAWSEATTGARRRFFVVLHLPPIQNAADAVRASILADVQRGTRD